jgi:hypothetical protein
MPYQDLEKRRLCLLKNRRQLRKEVLAAYGGKCARCGFADERALQIDHVLGGGCQHRKSFGGQVSFMLWLRRNKFPPEFQILCANCNWIKRAENKEYSSGRSSVI